MKKITAQFKVLKGNFGWYFQLQDGSIEVIYDIHSSGYENLSEEGRSFMKGESLEHVMAEIERVAKENSIIFEREDSSSIKLTKLILPEPVCFDIDLCWELWDNKREIWSEYGESEAYDAAEKAFYSSGPAAKIHTAPKKENFWGSVIISAEKASYRFLSGWDAPYYHVPDDCPKRLRKKMEKEIEFFLQELNGYEDGDINYPIGAEVYGEIEAHDFEELMLKLYRAQEEMFKENSDNWEHFQTFIKNCFAGLEKKN